MQILRHAHEVSAYLAAEHDRAIKALIHTRIGELLGNEDTPMEEVVFFVILDAQDDRLSLESKLGIELMTPEGFPLWEVIEAHHTCYELVFVLSSSGYGALVIAPEQCTHPEILALCESMPFNHQKGLNHDP